MGSEAHGGRVKWQRPHVVITLIRSPSELPFQIMKNGNI